MLPRASLSFIVVFSNKQFYNNNMWINAHPVYGAGIQTHVLQNMSLLPYPLDQGFHPCKMLFEDNENKWKRGPDWQKNNGRKTNKIEDKLSIEFWFRNILKIFLINLCVWGRFCESVL